MTSFAYCSLIKYDALSDESGDFEFECKMKPTSKGNFTLTLSSTVTFFFSEEQVGFGIRNNRKSL